MKKKIIWAILIVLAVIIAIAIFGSYLPTIDRMIGEQRTRALMEQYEKDKAAREARLRADTTGGKTPEETVRLFVAALRQKDALAASRYYEISSQDKALESLKKELAERGDFQRTIDYFEEVVSKGKKVCEENRVESGCDFVYDYFTTEDSMVDFEDGTGRVFVPSGTRQNSVLRLYLNSYTSVWKLKK